MLSVLYTGSTLSGYTITIDNIGAQGGMVQGAQGTEGAQGTGCTGEVHREVHRGSAQGTVPCVDKKSKK